MKRTATIEMRLRIAGEWEAWKPTTYGKMPRVEAIALVELKTAEMLRTGYKEYRVVTAAGRQIWPATSTEAR